jgi:hypothetical protein
MRKHASRASVWLLGVPALAAGFSLADPGAAGLAAGAALAAAKAILAALYFVDWG